MPCDPIAGASEHRTYALRPADPCADFVVRRVRFANASMSPVTLSAATFRSLCCHALTKRHADAHKSSWARREAPAAASINRYAEFRCKVGNSAQELGELFVCDTLHAVRIRRLHYALAHLLLLGLLHVAQLTVESVKQRPQVMIAQQPIAIKVVQSKGSLHGRKAGLQLNFCEVSGNMYKELRVGCNLEHYLHL